MGTNLLFGKISVVSYLREKVKGNLFYWGGGTYLVFDDWRFIKLAALCILFTEFFSSCKVRFLLS